MTLRPVPEIGVTVDVAFLDDRLPATVVAVSDGGRRFEVLTADGERISFSLSRATARFVASDGTGARILFR